MANAPLNSSGNNATSSRSTYLRQAIACFLLVAAVLLTQLLFAQGPPRVISADPTSGKADDMVTLTGENLGSATVLSVFLSDDKTDYKATVVDQADAKIVIKVPKVKAGSYNISVQVSTNIYIEPVKFTVQE